MQASSLLQLIIVLFNFDLIYAAVDFNYEGLTQKSFMILNCIWSTQALERPKRINEKFTIFQGAVRANKPDGYESAFKLPVLQAIKYNYSVLYRQHLNEVPSKLATKLYMTEEEIQKKFAKHDGIRDYLEIPSYSLPYGLFKFIVIIQIKDPTNQLAVALLKASKISQQCFIYIKSNPPKVNMVGGAVEKVRHNQDTRVKAELPKEFQFIPPGEILIKWTKCENSAPKPNFCDSFNEKSAFEFTIPAKFATARTQVRFTGTTSLAYIKKSGTATSQKMVIFQYRKFVVFTKCYNNTEKGRKENSFDPSKKIRSFDPLIDQDKGQPPEFSPYLKNITIKHVSLSKQTLKEVNTNIVSNLYLNEAKLKPFVKKTALNVAIEFPPYSLIYGLYKLTISMSTDVPALLTAVQPPIQDCYFEVSGKPPQPKIEGESKRLLPVNTETGVKVTMPADPFAKQAITKDYISYTWICNQEPNKAPNFCTDWKRESPLDFKIPAKYAIKTHKISLQIQVKLPYLPKIAPNAASVTITYEGEDEEVFLSDCSSDAVKGRSARTFLPSNTIKPFTVTIQVTQKDGSLKTEPTEKLKFISVQYTVLNKQKLAEVNTDAVTMQYKDEAGLKSFLKKTAFTTNIEFLPYSLPYGLYKITVKLSSTDKKYEELIKNPSYDCYFEVKDEVPKPIIEGGASRVVKANLPTDIKVSIQDPYASKNLPKDYISYKWECKQEPQKAPNFCTDFKQETPLAFTIPEKYAVKNNRISLTLQVTLPFLPKQAAQTASVSITYEGEDEEVVLTDCSGDAVKGRSKTFLPSSTIKPFTIELKVTKKDGSVTTKPNEKLKNIVVQYAVLHKQNLQEVNTNAVTMQYKDETGLKAFLKKTEFTTNIEFSPFSLPYGLYKLNVKLSTTDKKYEELIKQPSNDCFFEVKDEVPTPKIEGDANRVVNAKLPTDIKVSIQDPYASQNLPKDYIDYKWECKQEPQKEPNFCTDWKKEEPLQFTIPAKYAIKKNKISLTLQVTLPFLPKQTAKTASVTIIYEGDDEEVVLTDCSGDAVKGRTKTFLPSSTIKPFTIEFKIIKKDGSVLTEPNEKLKNIVVQYVLNKQNLQEVSTDTVTMQYKDEAGLKTFLKKTDFTTNIEFPPYSLPYGLYKVTVKLSTTDKKYEDLIKQPSNDCFFEVKDEVPTPKIDGEANRFVNANLPTDIKVSIQDPYASQNHPKDYIAYKWECKQEPQKEPNFCTNWKQEEPLQFTIPEKYAIKPNRISLTLQVTLPFLPKQAAKTASVTITYEGDDEEVVLTDCSGNAVKGRTKSFLPSTTIKPFTVEFNVTKKDGSVTIAPNEKLKNVLVQYAVLNKQNLNEVNTDAVTMQFKDETGLKTFLKKTDFTTNIEFPPYSLLYGLYKLTVKLSTNDKKFENLLKQPSYDCYFEVKDEVPKPAIEGEAVRNIKSNLPADIKVSVLDPFAKQNLPKDYIAYKWQCKQEPQTEPNFCTDWKQDSPLQFTIAPKFAIPDHKISLTLQVTLPYLPKQPAATAQVVINYKQGELVVVDDCAKTGEKGRNSHSFDASSSIVKAFKARIKVTKDDGTTTVDELEMLKDFNVDYAALYRQKLDEVITDSVTMEYKNTNDLKEFITDGKFSPDIEFKPYSLPYGLYKLIIKISASDKLKELMIENPTTECYFEVKGLPPKPNIAGGAKQEIKSNNPTDVKVTVENPYSANVLPKEHINYKWQCKQVPQSEPNFCTDWKQDSPLEFTIPAKFAIAKNEIHLSLDVTLVYLPKQKASSADVTIFYKQGEMVIISECYKNAEEGRKSSSFDNSKAIKTFNPLIENLLDDGTITKLETEKLNKITVTYETLFSQKLEEVTTDATTFQFKTADNLKQYLKKGKFTTNIEFPAYSLPYGFYKLTIKLTTSEKEYESLITEASKECYFEVTGETPPAIIDGGAKRVINLNLPTSVKVTVKDPYADGVLPKNHLAYKWDCQQTPPNPPNFCTDWKQESPLEFPIDAKYAIDKNEIKLVLKVTLPFLPKQKASTAEVTITYKQGEEVVISKCNKTAEEGRKSASFDPAKAIESFNALISNQEDDGSVTITESKNLTFIIVEYDALYNQKLADVNGGLVTEQFKTADELKMYLSAGDLAPKLVFPPYSLPYGLYKLAIKLSAKEKAYEALIKEPKRECYFEVRADPPKPSVVGGSDRSIPSNSPTDVVINIDNPFTNEQVPKEKLTYDWQCQQKPSTKPNFCEDWKKEEPLKFTIPPKYAIANNEINLTLNVKIPLLPTQPASTTTVSIKYKQGEEVVLNKCYNSSAEGKEKSSFTPDKLINEFNALIRNPKDDGSVEVIETVLLKEVTVTYEALFRQTLEAVNTNEVTMSYKSEEELKTYLKENQYSTNIEFSPYSLPYGLFKLVVNLKSKNKEYERLVLVPKLECYFEIKGEAPKPTIEGGSTRIEFDDSPTDVKVSIDNPYPNKNLINAEIAYKWDCKQEPATEPNFCTDWKQDSPLSFTIPAKFAIDKHVITLNLKVSLLYLPKATPSVADLKITYKEKDRIVLTKCFSDPIKGRTLSVDAGESLIAFNAMLKGKNADESENIYENATLSQITVTYSTLYKQTLENVNSDLVTLEYLDAGKLKKFLKKSKFTTDIVFPKYSLPFGFFKLIVELSASEKDYQAMIKKPKEECYFEITGKTPIPIIAGNKKRIVIINNAADIVVTLDHKFAKSVLPDDYLAYKWDCKHEPADSTPDYCSDWKRESPLRFTIPAKYAIKEHILNLEISASIPYLKTPPPPATAKITIIYKTEQIIIDATCEKNCLKSAVVTRLVFLKVRCTKLCDYVTPELYSWKLYNVNDKDETTPVEFDYQASTQFGPNTNKFIIKANTLKPGNYRAIVQVVDKLKREGESSVDFNFKETKNYNCKIEPPKGISFLTKFKVVCEGLERPNDYQLYKYDESTKKMISIISGSYPNEHVFELPPTTEADHFSIRIQKDDDPEAIIKMTAIVVSPFYGDGTKKIIDKVIKFNNEIDNDLNVDDDVQKKDNLLNLQNLIKELVLLNDTNPELLVEVEKLKQNLLKTFDKMNLVDDEDFNKVTNIMIELMKFSPNPDNPPSDFKGAQKICEKIAAAKVKQLQEYGTRAIEESEHVKVFSTSSADCRIINSEKNIKILTATGLEVSTWIPTFNGSIDYIKEDYKDYMDYDENYSKNLLKYMEGSNNIIRTTMLTAKSIALTMISGEAPVNQTVGDNDVLTAKDEGRSLYLLLLTSQDVSVKASADWENSDHDFDILISTWRGNFLWWNVNKSSPATTILKIEFWHSTCKDNVSQFKKPVNIFFEMKYNTSVFIEDTVKNDKFICYRVEMQANVILNLMFTNLIQNDIIRIIFSLNLYPMLEDFQRIHSKITANDSFITFLNKRNESVFCYIGLLTDASSGRTSIPVNMSFTELVCIKFDNAEYQWRPSCSVGNFTNQTHLNCACYNFSVLAGNYTTLNAVKFDLIPADVIVELQVNWVIIYAVLVVLALYCLIVCFLFKRYKEHVYFMCDNKKKHHYAYFLLIRTSNARKSGTSSNVVFTLTGDLYPSKPHVLNYPDPQMRILQRNNKDIFVLATPNTLGNILYLDLWFDSIGFSPAYHCQDIWVHDLQDGREWYFVVNQRLDILNGVTHIRSFPTQPDTDSKRCNLQFRVCDCTHGWSFIHIEETLSHIKRLTILLSNILLTLCLVMIIYGLPKYEIYDFMDSYSSFDIGPLTIGFGVGAAFCSFVIHYAIAWLIRSATNEKISKLMLALLFILLGFSITMLFIFGLWVPYYTSLHVVAAAVIGLLISALIFENIAIMIRTTLFHKQFKNYITERFHLLLASTEAQRTFLYATFGPSLLRSHFRHLYKPMKFDEIQEKKVLTQLRSTYLEDLEDLIWFCIYMILLYCLVIMNLSSMNVISNKVLIDEVDGVFSRTISFEGDVDIDNFYDYINDTLIAIIQYPNWYGNYVHGNPGMMMDMSHKYLGIIRLRQHRMPIDLCAIPKIMKFVNLSCWAEFSRPLSDIKPFSPRWSSTKDAINYKYYRLNHMFHYSQKEKTGTTRLIGSIATYPGGGYVATLGRTLHNSKINLFQIVNKSWIDEHTRGIFIEFLTYSSNTNIFNAITLIMEQSASGFLHKTIIVDTAQMLFTEGQTTMIKYVIFFIFLIWVAMLLIKQSATVVKKVKTFFKDVWFYMDLFIISLSVICIWTSVIRTNAINAYIKQIEVAKHNEFVNYFYLFHLEHFLKVFAAILICMATIRLWRFLRFAQIFRMLERTIVLSCGGILTTLLVFLLVVMAFGFSGCIMFGEQYTQFRSAACGVRTFMLITFFANFINYTDYVGLTPIATIFFSSWLITAMVIKNLFIVLLMHSYSRTQRQFSERLSFYTVPNYLREKFRRWPKVWRYGWKRLRGGRAKPDAITLKGGEDRYENSLSINSNKLLQMKCIAKAVLANMNRKNRTRRGINYKLMIGAIKHVTDGIIRKYKVKKKPLNMEETTFYTGHKTTRRKVCVAEQRVLLIKDTIERYLVKKKVPTKSEGKSTLKSQVFNSYEVIKKTNVTLRSAELKIKVAAKKFNDIVKNHKFFSKNYQK